LRSLKFTVNLVFLTALAVGLRAANEPSAAAVSGQIADGLRILRIDGSVQNPILKVYRGDYIQFAFDKRLRNPLLKIPSLSIEQVLSSQLSEAPYFKMKSIGTYSFALGEISGVIEVVEFQGSNYAEVSSEVASEMIKASDVLILDVRTREEYERGHLKNSILVPVQELESRIGELSPLKDQDILVYCASGNRSTVASKILIDNDFKKILNLRHGFSDWQRMNYPVAR